MYRGKAVIVGSGFVGSTTAFTLMQSGIFSEIAIIDLNKDKAEGDAMDMNHGVSFVTPVKITAGGYEECADADMVIITAGANQKPGETRIDLLKRNTVIFKSIIDNILKFAPHQPLIVVVTNPVDILTYAACRLSGYPAGKVIGSGTVLDTSRLKFLLSEHTGIDARSIHTYVLGEHGDTEVAAWSVTSIAGLGIRQYCEKCARCDGNAMGSILDRVRGAAYEIIEKKGATYYAVALAVRRIVESIVNDEKSILTVSGMLRGEYGISDVCLSVPTVVGKNGAERIIETPLSAGELADLKKSAAALAALTKELGL